MTPEQADLAVTKTVDDLTPNVGQQITFTVNLSNLGPDPATSVSLGDPLPAGLPLVSFAATLGTYDPTTGIWVVGTLRSPRLKRSRSRPGSPPHNHKPTRRASSTPTSSIPTFPTTQRP